jgi:CMP-N,N'-diacetyllegionaminic acid synthase
MKVLWIIPARSGSKWVIRKNIRDFCGKPLIAWSIEETKKTKLIDKVIVSTDSSEIAEIARDFGAEVPFLRPKEISTDTSTDIEFIQHALDWLKQNENYVPDIILRLPPTSPLRTYKHIEQGINLLVQNPSYDSVRPITESSKHPYKMWTIKDGLLEPFLKEEFTWIKEAYNMPRQIFPEVFVQTGAMDVIRINTILKNRSTSWKDIGFFRMESEDAVNIDSEVDFKFAELLFKEKNK